jgi:hypothetical protein
MFQTGVGVASRYSLPATGNGLRIFFIFLLILLATAVIGIGVAFVGCALAFKI